MTADCQKFQVSLTLFVLSRAAPIANAIENRILSPRR